MRTPQAASGNYFGNIESLKGRKDPEALQNAAKELESLFAYEMIKAMRETSEINGGGLGKDTYMSMFDMELSRLFADRGLGLKELLLKGLNRQAGNEKDQGKQTLPVAAGPLNGTNSRTNKPSPPEPKPESRSLKPLTAPKAAVELSDPIFGDMDHDEPSMPVDGRVSSNFGMRNHPVHGGKKFHHGMDIAAPAGTEIYPYRGGRVVFSGDNRGYGNMIIIDHGDGYVSRYAHNRVNLVRQGDQVDENTVIAEVGSTGISTGPHLHFEVRQNGRPMDPAKVLAMR